MSDQTDGHGRWLIRLGVGGFIATALGLFALLASVQAGLVEHLYGVDPTTGVVIERVPLDQRSSMFESLYSAQWESLLSWTGAALLSILLVLIGLWRADPSRRRVLIAAPVALPLVIGLCAGALSDGRLDDLLESLFVMISAKDVAHSGMCMPHLETCSRMRALDSVWGLAIVVASLGSVALLVPAARAAWRADKRGTRLGLGWRVGAIALFGVGALALISTTPHARDRDRLLDTCDEAPGNVWVWTTHLTPNPSSLQLQAVVVPRCEARLSIDAPGPVDMYQLFETGVLAERPRVETRQLSIDELYKRADIDPHAMRERLDERIDDLRFIVDQRDEEMPAVEISIYADARTSAKVLGQHLQVARRAGVEAVVLVGQSTLTGELDSVGPRRRRVYCPIGRVHFDAEGTPLGDFETWADLAAAVTGSTSLAIAL